MVRPDDVTREEEIASPVAQRPHVVLLGAGASLAACPQGDRDGKKLPLMWNFTDVVPIKELVPEQDRGTNFEAFYSRIAQDPAEAARCAEIERRTYEYFASLNSPDEPTIYDYLVLSLRQKDVIATFNWDPFLLQAVQRTYPVHMGEHPRLLFLHGNVLVGTCSKHDVVGRMDIPCPDCGQALAATQLLYPVAKKDYTSDAFLRGTWAALKHYFSTGRMLTIFGYGAPAADAEAVALLKSAWGTPDQRQFEQVEVIDVKKEKQLRKSWDAFIHSHHYSIHSDFFASSLALHPRRTIEDWWWRNLMTRYTTPNPLPRGVALPELNDWMMPLAQAERGARRS